MKPLKTQTVLVALPEDSECEGIHIWSLIEEVVHTENKIRAEVAEVDSERARFLRIQDRIEFATRGLNKRSFPNIEYLHLDTDYLDFLKKVFIKEPEKVLEIRLGAAAFTHEQVKQHATDLTELLKIVGLERDNTLRERLAFFNQIKRKKRAIVELQIPWRYTKKPKRTVEKEAEVEPKEVTKAFNTLPISTKVSSGDGNVYAVAFELARTTVKQVLKGQSGSLNLGLEAGSHPVIAETMHMLAYLSMQDHKGPISIPLVYTDGSEAAPFPVMSLRRRKEEELVSIMELLALRVGMLSTRHPEMDTQIDMYWFRNQEISIGGVAAEIDAVAYRKSLALLENARRQGPIRIEFYQTGFPPAVIGFYRAVTEMLMSGSKKKPFLVVTPFYFDKRKRKYSKGKTWS